MGPLWGETSVLDMVWHCTVRARRSTADVGARMREGKGMGTRALEICRERGRVARQTRDGRGCRRTHSGIAFKTLCGAPRATTLSRMRCSCSRSAVSSPTARSPLSALRTSRSCSSIPGCSAASSILGTRGCRRPAGRTAAEATEMEGRAVRGGGRGRGSRLLFRRFLSSLANHGTMGAQRIRCFQACVRCVSPKRKEGGEREKEKRGEREKRGESVSFYLSGTARLWVG